MVEEKTDKISLTLCRINMKTNTFVHNFRGSKQIEEHSYKTWQDGKRCGFFKKNRRQGRESVCKGRESVYKDHESACRL
jgi:hypothetical protein